MGKLENKLEEAEHLLRRAAGALIISTTTYTPSPREHRIFIANEILKFLEKNKQENNE